MESLKLLQQLTVTISKDFKGLKEEVDLEKDNSKLLKDTNETLQKSITEVKKDNAGLVKSLKELKEKYGRLHDKLKRKQEEISKKEKWWDKYRYTAETTIKKLRTLGSFSPDVLHEVSRDLVDIMEDGSSTETVSSQENHQKKQTLKKLSTTKYNKKKYRYADVSPDNTDYKTTKQQDHTTADKQTLKGNLQKNSSLSSESKTGNNEEKDFMDVDSDVNHSRNAEGVVSPCLTSTPLCTSTQTKLTLNSATSVDFPDLSMIVNSVGVGCPSNKATREIKTMDSHKKHENTADVAKSSCYGHKNYKTSSDRNTKSDSKNQNLKVLIQDSNKAGDDQSPDILDNIEHLRNARQPNLASTNQTRTRTDGDRTCSPSILPQDKKTRSQEKKRSSTTSSACEVKRQRMSSSNAEADLCSVVLLSSGEEDNGKLGSSVDMFDDGEKPKKDLSFRKKSVFDSSNIMNKVRTKKDLSSEETISKSSDDGSIRQNQKEDKDCPKMNQDEQKDKAEYSRTDEYDNFPGFRKSDEPTYKNVEVVRKKDERAKLKGFSCRDCAEYYGSLNLNKEELKKRLKHCSRHRAKYSPPPSTPPGFWNLSFPDTQEYLAKGMLQIEDENAPQLPKRKQRRRRLLGRNREQLKK